MNNLSIEVLKDSIKLANDLTNEYNWCGVTTAIDGMCGRCDYCRLFIGRTKRFSYNDLAEGIVCSRYTDLKALR